MQQEMKYVYQVYLDGSFSKAAEKLFLTQPALSIAIQKIETGLGMQLFDREQRPLTLTPAGEVYIDMIKKTMDLEQETTQKLNDIQDLESGTIRIGGSHYLNAYILPEVLAGFSNQYPKIQLELVENSSAALSEMLSEHKIDLTFNCSPKFIHNFKRYPAFYDTLLLAVPEADPIHQTLGSFALSAHDILNGRHLEKDCPSVPLKEFKELSFILLSSGNNLYDRSQQMFSDAGFKPNVKMVLSQLVTAYHMAEKSFAATFISDRLVQSNSSGLKFYKIDSDLIYRLFYILLPERKYTSFATQRFIDYFVEYMNYS
jgi:DNA-binding transcriptional LysR family regulator